jgi:hypothetical protein
MATTGVVNGTKVRIYVDLSAFGGSTYAALGTSLDATYNIAHSPRETTNQDSAGWASFLEGKRSGTIDFNCLYAEDSANNFEDWFTAVLSNTIRGGCGVKFGTATTGDMTYSSSGYITSISYASGGTEANATFSGSIQLSGAPTKAAVSS